MEFENDKLIRKAIKGNKRAFEQLIKKHYERIYRTAFLYVHNEEDALDVVQETTYQAYRSIHSLKQPEYFMTWLTRIIIRCAGQILKRRNNIVPLTDELLSNLSVTDHSDHDEAILLLRLNGKSTDIKKVKGGYNFQWKMEYPYRTIKENFTLPITIHYINGIKGEWNFNIPIQQENYSTLAIEQDINYPEVGIMISVDEILVAKASSSLNYRMVKNYKDDDVYIKKAVDDKGNVYRFGNGTALSESQNGDQYESTIRREMNQLKADISSLTFYPQLFVAEPKVQQRLDEKSFVFKSKRSNLVLQINNINKDGEKLVIDYQFLGLTKEMSKHRLELFENNLKYAFMLVDEKYLDKIDSENPFGPENHSISQNEVKIIDAKTAHFQSVFNLNGEQKIENYKVDNTILQFDFSSFIGVKELTPFTVELRKKNR